MFDFDRDDNQVRKVMLNPTIGSVVFVYSAEDHDDGY